jgi:hypothetical protein
MKLRNSADGSFKLNSFVVTIDEKWLINKELSFIYNIGIYIYQEIE